MAIRQGVSTGAQMLDHALNETALADTGTEESGVQGQDDPAAASEDDGGAQHAEPQGQLEASDERHAGIVVFLDEAADGISHTGRLGLLTSRGRWRRTNGGQDEATGVCQDVKDAIDGVWEESKWILSSKEPHEGHCCASQLGQ